MQFPKLIFLILILNLLKAGGIDTLTYYEKFDVAVQTYKEERYRLSEKYFSSILINDKDYRDPASQLMLAKSQYQQNKWQDAVRSAKSVLSNFPGSPYQDYTLLLMGDIALSQGKNSEAFQNYLSIRPTAKDSLQLSDINKRLIICIGNGLKEDRIEGILFREKNPTNRAIINLARAYLSWIKGDAYDFSLALNGIDIICHCAGLHGLDNSDINVDKKYFKSNVIGTQNIYKEANKKIEIDSINIITIDTTIKNAIQDTHSHPLDSLDIPMEFFDKEIVMGFPGSNIILLVKIIFWGFF